MIDFPIIPLQMSNVLVLKHKAEVSGVCACVCMCTLVCKMQPHHFSPC